MLVMNIQQESLSGKKGNYPFGCPTIVSKIYGNGMGLYFMKLNNSGQVLHDRVTGRNEK